MSDKLFRNAELRYQKMSDRLDRQIDHLVEELKSLSRHPPVNEDSRELTINRLQRIRLDFNRRVESCIPKHFSIPVFPAASTKDKRSTVVEVTPSG